MRIMYTIVIVVIVLLTLFFYMAYATNKKVERQKYDVVKNENGFEIRFYPKVIMASVTSIRQGNENNNNFRRLASYIFGGNKEKAKIAMTAPVYMERANHESNMSFVLPSGYNMNDLPHPNDSTISLHYSEEGYYAALRFSGFASESKITKKEHTLKELLNKAGYEAQGNYYYLGYNAPWDIINRENDIIVRIKYDSAQAK